MVRQHESLSQAQVLLALRFAIDTAIKYPNPANTESAIEIARAYPKALRSLFMNRNLGQARWLWLATHINLEDEMR